MPYFCRLGRIIYYKHVELYIYANGQDDSMQLILSMGTHIPTNGIAEICIYVGEMIATIMAIILEH